MTLKKSEDLEMKPTEKCGVLGIYSTNCDVIHLLCIGLEALHHRGQDISGLAITDNKRIHAYYDSTPTRLLSSILPSKHTKLFIGIGHNRYATMGQANLTNAQPILLESQGEVLAVAHNGNLTNCAELYKQLDQKGFTLRTTTDTELIAWKILSVSGTSWIDRVQRAILDLQGAYSLILLTKEEIIATRDPMGIRPLCFGPLKTNNGWAIASESYALEVIGVKWVREVLPGQIVLINSLGLKLINWIDTFRTAYCVFEYIYFSHHRSKWLDHPIHAVRIKMGERLAHEHPVYADVGIFVPKTAYHAAKGYCGQIGIPLIEMPYSNGFGRTFLYPNQSKRLDAVRQKFSTLFPQVAGKKVVLLDDSLVRGNIMKVLINILRQANAQQIHVRIASPPIKYSCFFGVDLDREELIASKMTIPEITQFLKAHTLGYLSEQGLCRVVGLPYDALCMACFSGNYPQSVPLEYDKSILKKLVFNLRRG